MTAAINADVAAMRRLLERAAFPLLEDAPHYEGNREFFGAASMEWPVFDAILDILRTLPSILDRTEKVEAAEAKLEAFSRTLLDNVREEIRPEVEYALSLALASPPSQ